jgi:hypothetical protein
MATSREPPAEPAVVLFAKTLKVMGRHLPGEAFQDYYRCQLDRRSSLLLPEAVTGFHRMDHIYEVLCEFRSRCEGRFSVLEFGVADGYSYTKKLLATKTPA